MNHDADKTVVSLAAYLRVSNALRTTRPPSRGLRTTLDDIRLGPNIFDFEVDSTYLIGLDPLATILD